MSEPILGRRLGSGKEADVLAFGAMAVKLYKPSAPKRSAFAEAANLALAGSFGLPVPAVDGVLQFGDRWGIVMARADGPSFAESMRGQPDRMAAHLAAMARLQLRVHDIPGTQFAGLKVRLAANIRQAALLGDRRQAGLLALLATLPEGDRLCHGDFHPANILGPADRAILVDWLDARSGDPAADLCRSFVLIERVAPDLATAYLDTYATASGLTREAIFRWLPVIAAARLAEGVPEEAERLIAMADGR